jgi:hypothetical protein
MRYNYIIISIILRTIAAIPDKYELLLHCFRSPTEREGENWPRILFIKRTKKGVIAGG